MNDIAIFHYDPLNLDVRIKDAQGSQLWIASDLAHGLGYRDAHDASKLVDNEDKLLIDMDTGFSRTPQKKDIQKVWAYTEPGMFQLLARSHKPAAKPFQRWLFHEVLPTIRRTGSYGLNSGFDKEHFKALLNEVLEDRISKEIERRWALMEARFLASHRHVAVDRVTALDCVIEWGGTEPKDRRSPTLKIGNALRRICNYEGIPIFRCDRTGVNLFPYDLAHKFMCEKGHRIVKEFMDSHGAQGVLQFPYHYLKRAHKTGKRA